MLSFKIQFGRSTYVSKGLKNFFGYNFDLKTLSEDIKFYKIIFKKFIFIKICFIIWLNNLTMHFSNHLY